MQCSDFAAQQGNLENYERYDLRLNETKVTKIVDMFLFYRKIPQVIKYIQKYEIIRLLKCFIFFKQKVEKCFNFFLKKI